MAKWIMTALMIWSLGTAPAFSSPGVPGKPKRELFKKKNAGTPQKKCNCGSKPVYHR